MGLSRDDWARAALFAVAEAGTSAVAVEPIAARLSATKGSFYWHFPNRAALVGAALELWETRATEDVIGALDGVRDPVERLRLVLAEAFAHDEEGRAEAALLASSADPVVGPVVRRVTERRLAFLDQIFAEIGFAPLDAARRARLAYGAYTGWYSLQRALPEHAARAERDGYVEHVLRTLVAPTRSPA